MSYDDDGKTATALVRIVKVNDQLIGQIEKVFDQQAEAICRNCRGDRKNQPIVGLEIIRGVKLEAQNNPDDPAEQLELNKKLKMLLQKELLLRKNILTIQRSFVQIYY